MNIRPIAQTILLPEHSNQTLAIDQSGTPDGYVLYAPKIPSSAAIDVANQQDCCIVVKASHIIIRVAIPIRGGKTDREKENANPIIPKGHRRCVSGTVRAITSSATTTCIPTTTNVTSRNNILHVKSHAIADRNKDPHGDYDCDLYQGRITAAGKPELHGVKAEPIYVKGAGLINHTGIFHLAPIVPATTRASDCLISTTTSPAPPRISAPTKPTHRPSNSDPPHINNEEKERADSGI